MNSARAFLLTLCLFGCSESRDVQDAGSLDAGSLDAGLDAAPASPQTYAIHAGGECPPRALPQGLQLRQYCDVLLGPCAWPYQRCTRDADCTVEPFGRCIGYDYGEGLIELVRCEYEGCREDGDCAEGDRCLCSPGGTRECVRADCEGDRDCPSGSQCVRADACGYGPFGPVVCTTATDECRVNEDCGARGNSCAFMDERLTCLSIICD